jgi:hypothetical protein
MTLTLQDADITGYYAALGIQLPAWATRNAPVRCFADPDRHRHEDRDPSASVDLISGAWLCHACGAHGGAYDAALTQGHTPRSAIDLMINHGLTERRSRLCTARELIPHSPKAPRTPPRNFMLQATESDVRRWQRTLSRRPNLAIRLADQRGWSVATMRELGLGWDQGRMTIPIRGQHHHLTGVLRYQPNDTGRPKMLAIRGTQLGLIPHPTRETSHHIVLVEGPPDMIAARSRGIPAIAVPGDHAWQPSWGEVLTGRTITIVMDADAAGRYAAQRIHASLTDIADARVVDLAPEREDGYDLTDWLCTKGNDIVDPRHLGVAL